MSFCSADYGAYEYIHFNKQLFYEIAFNLIQSIYDLARKENKYQQVVEEIEMKQKHGHFKKFSDNNVVDDSDEDEMKNE